MLNNVVSYIIISWATRFSFALFYRSCCTSFSRFSRWLFKYKFSIL